MEYPIVGISIEELEDNNVYRKFFKTQKKFKRGFVRLMPYQQIMPKDFIKYAKRIHDFDIRSNDVWISSFPKCGTTWTQEMVWCIVNNQNIEVAKKCALEKRVPFFELQSITDDVAFQEMTKNKGTAWMKENIETMNVVENMKSPRIVKTHLSWQMLPMKLKANSNAKIVYVTRNPRDACVSYHNHWKVMSGYSGGFEEFAEAFINDVAGFYSPFIHHVLEYWKWRHLENVCFITYEEMKTDLASVIRKVGSFLEHPVPEDKIPSLVEHLSFDKMKENKAVNKDEFVQASRNIFEYKNKAEKVVFMRKGEVGDWKNHFTPELEKKFEEWENKWLKDSDLKFQYEILNR